MHKNMRRSLMILFLQEVRKREYSLAITKHIWKLKLKDRIKLMRRRQALLDNFNRGNNG